MLGAGGSVRSYPMPLKGVAAKHWPMVQAIMRIRVTR